MKERFPEKGRFAEPLTLPVNGRDAWIEVFSVLTLAVVPTTGTCSTATAPLCPFVPDRGSSFALEPCAGEFVPPTWAKAGATRSSTGRIVATFFPQKVRGFIKRYLLMRVAPGIARH